MAMTPEQQQQYMQQQQQVRAARRKPSRRFEPNSSLQCMAMTPDQQQQYTMQVQQQQQQYAMQQQMAQPVMLAQPVMMAQPTPNAGMHVSGAKQVKVDVPAYGGGGVTGVMYNGVMISVDIPKDAKAGSSIWVDVPVATYR
jgi:hypothetical protein